MSDKTPKLPTNGNPSSNEAQHKSNDVTPNKDTSKAQQGDNKVRSANQKAKFSATKPVSEQAQDKKQENQTDNADKPNPECKSVETATTVNARSSSGGKGLALLAILIALSVGGAGYYFGMQKYHELAQQLQQANQSNSATPSNDTAALETALSQLKQTQEAQAQELANTKAQLAQANTQLQALSNHVDLEKAQQAELRNQLNKLSFNNKSQASDWLMSEADFLLTNAQRKLVLDGDIDTVISLLQSADASLEKVQTSQAVAIRSAIRQDINQLQNLNDVDQDLIMSKLSLLISQVDNLKVLSLNTNNDNVEVSDSVDDWQQNLEKSATSFLDHFIRVSKKDKDTPELLAPNQDIYLRENIRMSLQIALAAVPRQQNEVYKQSLDSVATWLRSYFDTDDASVEQFLQQVDQLKEQSIYIDAPAQLSAWKTISAVLNRNNQVLETLSTSTKASEQSAVKSDDVNAENSEEKTNANQHQPHEANAEPEKLAEPKPADNVQ
ncbi:uroporphyrinogen-III C-methyltransferase [Spirabiliibacterium falconis]|uniref:uroporphyrinogen-III C-methyltransferase n=1 Tax=Spirabiliibacterium falconis TaxID=572023 RepID=UPI001AADF2A5|nr:uroporphyrinogen-III C-methyltransferase [Spirabiliibacterium falconis]MBE2895065.1 uroporphyrinogen-III C-methyltransferase [Spirabiliibacterium falconis]